MRVLAKYGRLFSLGFATVLVAAFQNCGGVKFNNGVTSSGGVNGTGTGVSCPLQSVTIPIKVLFVVDTSGSNLNPFKSSGSGSCTVGTPGCVPATDPDKTFRGGSISSFFNAYSNKTNFSWGFETFAGTSAVSYISSGNNAAFGNASAMQTAIQAFATETDNGATPYLAGLNAAKNAISNDPDINSTAAHPPLYFIIFMSDGYPTDASVSDINAKISSIVALAPGRVTLSSVYYGTQNDPTAAGTLQSMAATGLGQFVNVDTSAIGSISIQDLISVPAADCQ